MTLAKVSLLTSIATLVGLICNFLIAKLLAVFLGPMGFAIMGQFQNFIQLAQACSSGMLGHGVVKYVAEYKNDQQQKSKLLSTALAISLISAIIIGCIVFTLRHYFALKILKSAHYSPIIGLFAFSFVFYVLNLFFLEVMNGERDTKRLTLGNMITNLSALFLTLFLVTQYHIVGGLLVFIISPIIVFGFLVRLMIKSHWFKIKNYFSLPNKAWVINLFRYALMTLVSALLTPLVQLFLRNHIIQSLSWREAGYWDAITKISDVYLLVITTTLAVYYLPKLSELTSTLEIKKEILFGYKTIFPVAILLAFLVFLVKKPLIFILFSHDFLPMLLLFKYQLLGDVLKVGAWLLSYILLAKAMVRLFILMEIIFSCSYALLAVILLHYEGLPGVTLAFAISYAIYWTILIMYFRFFKGL